jgi:hypothetical protein
MFCGGLQSLLRVFNRARSKASQSSLLSDLLLMLRHSRTRADAEVVEAVISSCWHAHHSESESVGSSRSSVMDVITSGYIISSCWHAHQGASSSLLGRAYRVQQLALIMVGRAHRRG